MPKAYIKIINTCYDCPGYYCNGNEDGIGICRVADGHEVTNPFTIYGWCPLVDKKDMKLTSNMDVGYIHTIKH